MFVFVFMFLCSFSCIRPEYCVFVIHVVSQILCLLVLFVFSVFMFHVFMFQCMFLSLSNVCTKSVLKVQQF